MNSEQLTSEHFLLYNYVGHLHPDVYLGISADFYDSVCSTWATFVHFCFFAFRNLNVPHVKHIWQTGNYQAGRPLSWQAIARQTGREVGRQATPRQADCPEDSQTCRQTGYSQSGRLVAWSYSCRLARWQAGWRQARELTDLFWPTRAARR